MREDFLHYVWKFGLFEKNNLETTDLIRVQIVKTGMPNIDAGPDFFNAKIYLDNELWVGNVEIHVNESDWNRHGHQKDEAYNNVILHVVFNADGKTLNANGKSIPVLALNNRISKDQYNRYSLFLNSKQFIPCASKIKEVDEAFIFSWLERVLVGRLERKLSAIVDRLNRNKGDWHQTFWECLSISFGFKTNGIPFEMLALNTPYLLLEKYRHSLLTIEALLFGQAGFLKNHSGEAYYKQLQNEYAFLQEKHRLIPMSSAAWKFGRLRPGNFPTIRLAQIAKLIHLQGNLFNTIIEANSCDDIRNLFQVSASNYWDTHHNFEKKGARKYIKLLGKDAVNGIIINVVVPFLFAYGRHIDQQLIADRGLRFLEVIEAEENRITAGFEKLGLKNEFASTSQALIELKSQFCDEKKCLNCNIGVHLIKGNAL